MPVAVAPPSLKPVRDKAQAQSLIEQSRELLRVDFHRALTCAHDAATIAEEIGDATCTRWARAPSPTPSRSAATTRRRSITTHRPSPYSI